jgi:hypothetical protein
MASFDEFKVGGNFNGTTGNLGWNTKGLEERGLSRFHTSVTGWDEHIGGGNSSSTGRSSDLVGENDFTGFLQVTVREDETDVTW